MINILSNVEKEAFKAIKDGIQKLKSSKEFKNYLRFLAKFHNYSFHNTILILNQCPNASFVAGYSAWKYKFKRNVKKGEKAIKILAPYYLKKLSDDGQEEFVVTRFKLVSVFDISQTEGEEIPNITKELNGESYEAKLIIQTISDICDSPIIYRSSQNDITIASGAKGYYNPVDEVIVIDKNLQLNQMAKTLCHEFAHSILHRQSDKKRRIKEIEAEALAFFICHYFGLDTSNYSFPYIASYARKDDKFLEAILLDIQMQAHEIIEKIKPIHYSKSVLTNLTNPSILTGNSLTSWDVK